MAFSTNTWSWPVITQVNANIVWRLRDMPPLGGLIDARPHVFCYTELCVSARLGWRPFLRVWTAATKRGCTLGQIEEERGTDSEERGLEVRTWQQKHMTPKPRWISRNCEIHMEKTAQRNYKQGTSTFTFMIILLIEYPGILTLNF